MRRAYVHCTVDTRQATQGEGAQGEDCSAEAHFPGGRGEGGEAQGEGA